LAGKFKKGIKFVENTRVIFLEYSSLQEDLLILNLMESGRAYTHSKARKKLTANNDKRFIKNVIVFLKNVQYAKIYDFLAIFKKKLIFKKLSDIFR
jgi:hypothetical protein